MTFYTVEEVRARHGISTHTSGWPPKYLDQLYPMELAMLGATAWQQWALTYANLASRRSHKMKDRKSIDFSKSADKKGGWVKRDNIDFSGFTFPEKVLFKDLSVSGDLKITKAKFLKDLLIERCSFKGLVDFTASESKGSVTIEKTATKSNVIFNNFNIKGDFNCDGLKLQKAISAIGLTVSNKVTFQNSTFLGLANFQSLEATECSFRKSVFSKEATLNGLNMRENADFQSCHFKEGLEASSIAIGGNLNFENATLASNADFTDLKVTGNANFQSCIFKYPLDATNILIEKCCNFDKAIFEHDADFQNLTATDCFFKSASFKKAAFFDGMIIKSNADFTNCEFNGLLGATKIDVAGDFDIEKATFSDEVDFTDLIVAACSFRGCKFNKKAVFCGLRAETNADFQGCHFETFEGTPNFSIKEICNFSNSTFVGQADFTDLKAGECFFKGVCFKQPAIFDGMIINENADFSHSKFRASLKAIKVVAMGNFKAEYATFLDNVNFTSLNAKTCSFSESIFSNGVCLNKLMIGSDANFKKCHLKGKLEAEEIVIKGNLNFHTSTFSDVGFSNLKANSCIYSGSTFHGITSFKEIVLERVANFSDCTFKKTSLFNGLQCKINAGFSNCTFQNEVDFQNCEMPKLYLKFSLFLKPATIENVRCNINLVGSKFHSPFAIKSIKSDMRVNAKSLKCLSDFSLLDSIINSSLDFSDSLFRGNFKCQDIEISKSVNFSRALFLGAVSFSDTTFKRAVDFNYVGFGSLDYLNKSDERTDFIDKLHVDKNKSSVPDFVTTTFAIPPNLGYTDIPCPEPKLDWPTRNSLFEAKELKYKPASDPAAPAKYRRLKELAAQGLNHMQEAEFFRQELKSKRGLESFNPFAIAAISLFEYTSHCGTSMIRPFSFWLAQIVFFMLFYTAFIDMPIGNYHWKITGHLFNYSMAQSIPFLGIIQGGDSVAIGYLWGGTANIPFWAKVLSSLQTIVGSIFLFLSLLAVRNYFKLK